MMYISSTTFIFRERRERERENRKSRLRATRYLFPWFVSMIVAVYSDFVDPENLKRIYLSVGKLLNRLMIALYIYVIMYINGCKCRDGDLSERDLG
jgi:hypothetical protein